MGSNSRGGGKGGGKDDSRDRAMTHGTEQSSPKHRKKLWPFIAGGIVLVVVAMVLMAALGVFSGSDSDVIPGPVLYLEAGEAYMAVGSQRILLEDASIVESYGGEDVLNAMLSYDRETLYYLTNTDSAGECDLMRIALWTKNAAPECVASGICNAEISKDGAQILYTTNEDDYEYELYLCEPGQEPEMIADSVSEYNFGFSPNGKYIYYTTKDSVFEKELILVTNGKEYEVADLEGVLLTKVFVDDQGRVLVVLYEDSEDNVYLYEDGDTERILKHVFWVMAAFGRADEFLYRTEDGQTYCYLQGDKTCLSEDGSLPRLVTDSTYDWRLVDKQFLIEDGGILYYVNLPNDPEEVGETDGYYVASPDPRYVLNLRDGDLYLMRRTGSAWQDVGKLCEYPLQAMFDPSGSSVYYISGAGEDAVSGELCLATVNSGVGESLLDDVTRVVLADGQIYAMTKAGGVYLVPRSGEPELITDGALAIYSGAEGVYMKNASGLYYCGSDEISQISESTSVLGINGYFTPAG